MNARSYGVSSKIHQTFIDSSWDQRGEQILQMLVLHGLLPNHTLLEVGGPGIPISKYLITFLKKGNYTGWDIESTVDSLHEIESLSSYLPSFVDGDWTPEKSYSMGVVYNVNDVPLIADHCPYIVYVRD